MVRLTLLRLCSRQVSVIPSVNKSEREEKRMMRTESTLGDIDGTGDVKRTRAPLLLDCPFVDGRKVRDTIFIII